MKLTLWAIVKIAAIAFIAIGVVTYRPASNEDAWVLAVCLAIGAACLALFQLVFWFFYDVVTLKRGGWVMPSFGSNPFANRLGPNFYIDALGIALLAFGAAKAVSAIFEGLPALVLAAAQLIIGIFFLSWQATLRKLFRSRFAREV